MVLFLLVWLLVWFPPPLRRRKVLLYFWKTIFQRTLRRLPAHPTPTRAAGPSSWKWEAVYITPNFLSKLEICLHHWVTL